MSFFYIYYTEGDIFFLLRGGDPVGTPPAIVGVEQRPLSGQVLIHTTQPRHSVTGWQVTSVKQSVRHIGWGIPQRTSRPPKTHSGTTAAAVIYIERFWWRLIAQALGSLRQTKKKESYRGFLFIGYQLEREMSVLFCVYLLSGELGLRTIFHTAMSI